MSVLTIEKLGRKWIQIQGFLMAALFRESTTRLPVSMLNSFSVGILAGKFNELSSAGFIVCFAFLQVGVISPSD